MFGGSALSVDDFDFAEDGCCSRLWREDVYLPERVLDYDEPVSSFDPFGDFSYSGDLKAFSGLSEEENRSNHLMESSINFAQGLLAFDLDDDYEFSQTDQKGLLPTIDINEDDSFPAEAVSEPFEGECLLTIPSSCTVVKCSEKSADGAEEDDCDDALERFNTVDSCVEPYTELNCDSTSDSLFLAPFDGDHNTELPSEFLCVDDVIPQSKDSRKIVPTRKQILVKVVRKFSSDSSDDLTTCPRLNYKSHVDVSNAAFGTDMGGMKQKTGDYDSDSSMDKCLNRNAIQARINRAKKKAYIARLEEQVQTLNKETEEMRRKIDTFEEKEANLVAEIQYLNSILANDSMLANLISNINGINTAELNSPVIINKKRKADMINNSESSKRLKLSSSEGICLHVCQDRLSLELCHHCANSSKASIASDNNRCKHLK